MEKVKKIIITGGGTGGHVYPAIAIADAIKKLQPDAKILFVGALGKLEMEKVPNAGYEIIGLPVSGLYRKISFKALNSILNFVKSIRGAKRIFKNFKPDIIIGVGGYASAPMLYVAKNKVCIALQEQNSFPGLVNRYFEKYAKYIFLGFPFTTKYLKNKEKTIFTGNPIRDLKKDLPEKSEIYKYFGLKPEIPILLLTGGSLGARSLNEAVIKNLDLITQKNIQFIWQTGKLYYQEMIERTKNKINDRIKIFPFIEKMNYAMEIADLVISRAGGITIAELASMHKPTILVPSPNVAEDHQTKNAQDLVENSAAIMIKDKDVDNHLFKKTFEVLENKDLLLQLSKNIARFAKPDAAQIIAKTILTNC